MRTTLSIRRAAAARPRPRSALSALTGCGATATAKERPTVRARAGQRVDGQLPKLDGEKISVAAVWTGPEQANFTKVLDEFEKRTGATVTFVPAQDPIVNFLGTKIAGGQPPDVAMIPQVGAIQQAVAKKWAKPVGNGGAGPAGPELRRRSGRTSARSTAPSTASSSRPPTSPWSGTTPTAFENAGASRPEDLEGLPRRGRDDLRLRRHADLGRRRRRLDPHRLVRERLPAQAGPEKYDQLAKHEIPWTDPSVKDALTTLAELWGKPT